MYRLWLGVLFVGLACAPLAAGENVAVARAGLLVKFKHEVSRGAAVDVLSRHGATEFAPLQRASTIEPTPMDRWWIMRFPQGSDLQKAAAALRAEPAVEIVEVEETYRVPR